ncbi:MAG: twin-arginine translocase subunit TatC [Coriobacteriales bacterium]|jgi:sec-independent protein translocase protein TatC|nr:twin-arginine translocase subunit TatC [Coriobacteriales bacterium]
MAENKNKKVDEAKTARAPESTSIEKSTGSPKSLSTNVRKRKKKTKDADKRMSIWGHLGELRRRLTIIAVTIGVASMVFYFLAPTFILFLLAPIEQYLPNPNNLPLKDLTNVLDALQGFTMRFYVGFVAAIVLTSPVWLWQILAFFLPALKAKERKWFIPTFAAGVSLFIIGVVFCYFVILDPAFEFLLGQTGEFANVFPNAANYVDTILLFLMAFGVAFELPLVIFYLTVFNIVPYKKLRKSWRVVYVFLLTLSAFITPDASPVTMVLMFGALVVLYEASLFLSRTVLAKRIKENEAREAAEAAEGRAATEAARAAKARAAASTGLSKSDA